MHGHYGEAIRRHRLRREIIALQVVNSMVNRVGGTFVLDIRERTGAGGADIARCFAIVRDSFALRDIWGEIEALDPQLVSRAQTAMLIPQRLTERVTVWCLRNLARPVDDGDTVTRLRAAVSTLVADLRTRAARGRDPAARDTRRLLRAWAREPLARKVARLDTLATIGDLANLADGAGVPETDVRAGPISLWRRGSGLDWLRGAAERLPRDNHWTIMAGAALIDDLAAAQRSLRRLGAAGRGIGRRPARRQCPARRLDGITPRAARPRRAPGLGSQGAGQCRRRHADGGGAGDALAGVSYLSFAASSNASKS